MKKEKKSFIDRIAPEAHTLGFFRSTLKTRRRLQATTLGVVVAQAALLLASGYIIENYSHSPNINLAAVAILHLTLIVTAYFVALTIGDLIFPGPWREKMYHAERHHPKNYEEEEALVKNRGIYFIALWLLCIIAVTWGIDAATGQFLQRYRQTGNLVSLMRSHEKSDKIMAYEVLADPLSRRRWTNELLREEASLSLQSETDPDVLSVAAFAAGRIGLAEAADTVLLLLKHDEPSVRMEAALALARMEWKAARAALLQRLQGSLQAKEYDEAAGILYALTLLHEDAAITPTTRALEACLVSQECTTEFYQNAFYLLKELQGSMGAKVAMAFLESEHSDDAVRCLAGDALRYTAKPYDVAALKRLFTQAPIDLECPPVYRLKHREPAKLLFDSEPLRAKLLRAIGNQRDMRNYDWIWNVGNNTSEHPLTRKVAEIYTRAMLGELK